MKKAIITGILTSLLTGILTLQAVPKELYYEDYFESTAYCHGTITATGTRPAKGTIAVDPAVIPYGTKLHVEGYGYGKALDCGGAINGKIIDVWLDSYEECISWGRRTVKVRIYY